MDDRPAASYCCPGETRPIERSLHLARMAAFYPACHECAHRNDVERLTKIERGQWAQLQVRRHEAPRFDGEGLIGPDRGFSLPVVRRFAAALTQVAWEEQTIDAAPAILVGSLGHWTTAELVAAACETIALAGCRAIDVGAVTSASLAAATSRLAADAALLIGNASGEPHALSLKAWGRGGVPASSPGRLDALRAADESPAARPRRHGGSIDRQDAAAAYRAPLATWFHGLRPLRFVLDTVCDPLLQHWAALSAQSACAALRPGASAVPLASVPTIRGAKAAPISPRMQLVADNVIAQQAHFGAWIDGDGEMIRLVDERGRLVDGVTLATALIGYVRQQQPRAIVLLDADSSKSLRTRWAGVAQAARGPASRQAMFDALSASGAEFGAGAAGRFWYATPPAAPAVADALLTLCLVLTMQSGDDRPLSEVLDAACSLG